MKFFWDYSEMLILLKTFTDNYTHGKQKFAQEKIWSHWRRIVTTFLVKTTILVYRCKFIFFVFKVCARM